MNTFQQGQDFHFYLNCAVEPKIEYIENTVASEI